MGKNDDRKHVHDLARFALRVLQGLDEVSVWGPLDQRIANIAEEMGFAERGWRRTEKGKQFNDTWYGPEPGEHVERDYH